MIQQIKQLALETLRNTKRSIMVALAFAIGFAPFMILNQTASASTITSRSVLISSAQAGGTANYTFTFTPSAVTQIQSIFFQACTTALGACTAPTTINLSGGSITQGGTWGGATSFVKDTATAAPVVCTATTNLCVKRTDTTVQTLVAHSIIATGDTNQAASNCSGAANCTFFIRTTTYSDNAYTTTNDTGTMASATTQLFTVNAAVQETLTFCVGATTIDDSSTTTPPACASVSGTSLNLGTLNAGNTNVSPVSAATANGDSNNGIAELSTNATNGATVTYDSIQQSGTVHLGTLRVSGATCSGVVVTDQCINPIGTTRAAIVSGTESFGMAIAAVNCKATTAYACAYGSGTYNLTRNANYNATGANTYTTDGGQISGTTNGQYAWDDTGTTQTIASSSTVVDKEALIMKFAATPSITTPTGSYTAKADFVATPTF
jgi:hypothetical protein